MKEKLFNLKEKIVELSKKALEWVKCNRLVTAVASYVIATLILILISVFALHEFVVSVCAIFIIEAVMAAILHKAEIWKHSVLIALQVLAGIIIGRILLIIICVISYVAATFALQLMAKKEEVSPEA